MISGQFVVFFFNIKDSKLLHARGYRRYCFFLLMFRSELVMQNQIKNLQRCQFMMCLVSHLRHMVSTALTPLNSVTFCHVIKSTNHFRLCI